MKTIITIAILTLSVYSQENIYIELLRSIEQRLEKTQIKNDTIQIVKELVAHDQIPDSSGNIYNRDVAGEYRIGKMIKITEINNNHVIVQIAIISYERYNYHIPFKVYSVYEYKYKENSWYAISGSIKDVIINSNRIVNIRKD